MPTGKAIGGHQSGKSVTYEWFTPPEIIRALGTFDLDPCTHEKRPWDTALNHYTKEDDGLSKPWFGRVFLNPPYGRYIIGSWMKEMSCHNSGIALTFARTETEFFVEWVWSTCTSIFFFDGRLHFYRLDGTRAKPNAGAPSVLIAYGDDNSDTISDAGLKGKHVPVNSAPIIVIGTSPSWVSVIRIALNRLEGEATVKQVYDLVEQIAPDKVQANSNYKEKIRQKLQMCFHRIKKGTYSITENLAA